MEAEPVPSESSSVPKQVLVEGAGTEEVNGVYSFNKIYNGCGLYRKEGLWLDGQNQTLALYCGGNWTGFSWHIAIVPQGHDPAPFNNRIIYYAPRSTENPGNGPPLTDWNTLSNITQFSKSPAPTLSLLDDKDDTSSTQHNIPQVAVVQPTASAYEKLLLSHDFSDIMLVCEDDTLPAHKNVLAVSSSYFHAAFAGPWNENEKGKLKIAYPSKVVKTILKVFYTGVLDMEAIQQEPIQFIGIASELDLPWLKEVAKRTCSETIDKNNLKNIWQAARLYECNALKSQCIDYAKNNVFAVFLHGGISMLQVEDPASWQDFVNEMEREM